MDGIIQKVLDKYYDRIMASDFAELRKELIAEIKKHTFVTNYDATDSAISMRELIGDTE